MTRLHAVTRRPVLAALLIVAIAGLPACSSSSKSTACTQIGCHSGVDLDLNAFTGADRVVTEAVVCIDDHCETQRGTAANPLAFASASTPLTRATTVTVKVTLRGSGGRVLASNTTTTRLRKVQPNGPDCEPICYVAPVQLSRAGKLVPTTA